MIFSFSLISRSNSLQCKKPKNKWLRFHILIHTQAWINSHWTQSQRLVIYVDLVYSGGFGVDSIHFIEFLKRNCRTKRICKQRICNLYTLYYSVPFIHLSSSSLHVSLKLILWIEWMHSNITTMGWLVSVAEWGRIFQIFGSSYDSCDGPKLSWQMLLWTHNH